MNIHELMNMLNPQAMQAKVEELRAKTAGLRVTGSSGGGLVKISLNGEFEMLSCEIAPEAVASGDVALLQDLLRGAFNDAAAKVKEAARQQLTESLGGIPMPPGFPGGLA